MELHSCALPKGNVFAECLGKALGLCFKSARGGALLAARRHARAERCARGRRSHQEQIMVWLASCCTKLLGCHVVWTPSLFPPFLLSQPTAGSTPLPGLKHKPSPACLWKQRTISVGQPALSVKSCQAKKLVQGMPAHHTPKTHCWSVQGF